ncbi:hypothetical protein MJT46_010016 [Ovis ammon polii x Ovis aries]|nr:hypothetical protein MJT46_010016 [Ovis ammon polii x Ovis aries]
MLRGSETELSEGPRLSLSWRLLAGGRQETGDGSIPLPDVCEFQTGSRAARSPPPTAGCLGARLLTRRQQLLTFHGAGQGVTCGAHGAGCGLPFSGAMSTGQHRVTCLCLWVGPGELGHAGLTQGVITDVYAAFSLPAVPSWTPESAQEALLNSEKGRSSQVCVVSGGLARDTGQWLAGASSRSLFCTLALWLWHLHL